MLQFEDAAPQTRQERVVLARIAEQKRLKICRRILARPLPDRLEDAIRNRDIKNVAQIEERAGQLRSVRRQGFRDS